MFRGMVFLLISVIAIVTLSFHQAILDYALKFIELRFSSDQRLGPQTQNFVDIMLWIISVILILANFFWFSGKASDLYHSVLKIVNIHEGHQFFFEGLYESVGFNKLIFFSTSFLSFCLYLFVSLGGFFAHEGLIETTFSAGYLFGAIAFLTSFLLSSSRKSEAGFSFFRSTMIVLFLLTIILFGEEVSWGQNFFDWQSPGIFRDYNFQSETNIHNFFNPILHIGVYFFSLFLLFFALAFWAFNKKSSDFLVNLVIPHSSLIPLVIFMCLSGLSGFVEIFENLLALFLLCYGLRMVVLLKDKHI